MAFLVRHFDHAAPHNDGRPVRRIRRGAMTAFVDAETGYLVAGYSYNACVFAVFKDDSLVYGSRLYVNDGGYGPTTAKHVSQLRDLVNPDYFETCDGEWPGYIVHPAKAGPYADTIRNLYHCSAERLREECQDPVPVERYVERKRQAVDRHNACIDADAAERDPANPDMCIVTIAGHFAVAE